MTGCPIAHGYNPLEQNIVNDPYPALEALRAEGRAFYIPEFDHYVVTRYEDIEAMLYDRDTWSASIASSPLRPICPAAQKVLDDGGFNRVPTLNNADPPRHPNMRKTVLSCMTPRRMLGLEPALRTYAESLVKSLKDEPIIDFVSKIAFPFPGYAAFSLLGFPEEDTDQLKAWSETRVLLTYGKLTEDEQVRVAGDVVAMWQYCKRHVENKAENPGDDLTSDLVKYADSKPDDVVSRFDVLNMVYSMALAGHETTCNTIGNGVYALLTHRDQWERLVGDRSLIPSATEEILRYDGPVINQRRRAKVDTVIGGVPIPAEAKVMMNFASGDRDDALFPDGDRFDISRDNAELHLAFGKGAHLCLGAPLARLEVRIILDLLIDHMPDIELVPDQEITHIPNALFRGLTRLLVAPRGLSYAQARSSTP